MSYSEAVTTENVHSFQPSGKEEHTDRLDALAATGTDTK